MIDLVAPYFKKRERSPFCFGFGFLEGSYFSQLIPCCAFDPESLTLKHFLYHSLLREFTLKGGVLFGWHRPDDSIQNLSFRRP